MSYRTLVWVPVAVVLLFLGAELAMGPGSQGLALRVEVELAKVLWLFGAVAAARVFDAGDYLRRGWLLIATGVVFFLLRDVTQIPAISAAMPPTLGGIVRGVLVVM